MKNTTTTIQVPHHPYTEANLLGLRQRLGRIQHDIAAWSASAAESESKGQECLAEMQREEVDRMRREAAQVEADIAAVEAQS